MKQDMILVLDLGAVNLTKVARKTRELGVYSEIHAHDITVDQIKAMSNVKGIIICGGPNNVIDGQKIDVNSDILTIGLPVLTLNHELSNNSIDFPCDEKEQNELINNF
ncbi:MAG: glutamine-hydrolyzing GMP synthase, partial [Erysipelotrichaceae bacterium]